MTLRWLDTRPKDIYNMLMMSYPSLTDKATCIAERISLVSQDLHQCSL